MFQLFPFWSNLVHFVQFWSTLIYFENFGLFWPVLVYFSIFFVSGLFGLFWTFLVHFGQICLFLDRDKIMLNSDLQNTTFKVCCIWYILNMQSWVVYVNVICLKLLSQVLPKSQKLIWHDILHCLLLFFFLQLSYCHLPDMDSIGVQFHYNFCSRQKSRSHKSTQHFLQQHDTEQKKFQYSLIVTMILPNIILPSCRTT